MPNKTRQFLRRRLDSYEVRAEEKEERYWAWFSRGLDAMDDRPTLKTLFFILMGINSFYWILVLVFPFKVMEAFDLISEFSDKGVMLAVGVVFGTGLWITYILFRFKFPDLESPPTPTGAVMSSYSHQNLLERRFRIWLASVIGGVVNFFALFIVELFRLGNWYHP